MLKTCFGCCPLHHGVSAIALINIVLNIGEAITHFSKRAEHYEQFNSVKIKNDDNSTAENKWYDDWSYVERIPSEIYMDYILITTISWIVLEVISNFCLKQSTFKRSPQKIYLWLVIYYANLLFMVFHLVYYTILMTRHPTQVNTLFKNTRPFGNFFEKLAYIVIISLEIAIIHSYYISEEKNKLNDIIQLKWKYVSRGEVVSKGVDYTSSSAFNERTSVHTQGGSKIPPYITNIVQN